jgi:hypothetical protein
MQLFVKHLYLQRLLSMCANAFIQIVLLLTHCIWFLQVSGMILKGLERVTYSRSQLSDSINELAADIFSLVN